MNLQSAGRPLPAAPVQHRLLLVLWTALVPLRLAAALAGRGQIAWVSVVLGGAAVLLGRTGQEEFLLVLASGVTCIWVATTMVVSGRLVAAHGAALGVGTLSGAAAPASLAAGGRSPLVPLLVWGALGALTLAGGRYGTVGSIRPRPGEIWWAEVRFVDRLESKVRPVVITSSIAGCWFAVVPLTSQPGRRPRPEVSGPWSRGRRSFARIDDPRVLGARELRDRAGTLDPILFSRLGR